MLLLHGLGATGDVWRAYDGIAPDLPGHGSMPWDPPYTFERHAHAVAYLLTEPMPVVGHSMGGVVALALAAMHPEHVTTVVGVGIKVAWSDDDVARTQALAAKPPAVFPTRDEAVDRFLKVSGLVGLMDEPLEGLAPVIVDTLIAAFHRLRQEDGLAIVLVEQHARLALEFAARSVVLDRGKVVYDGASQPLLDDPQRLADLIGVAG